jgi:translocon-associated protein subunit alpha
MCFLFFLLVARCQSDEAVENTGEVNDIGIVGDETDDAQDFADGTFPSAPGIDTIAVFPKNIAKCKDLSI